MSLLMKALKKAERPPGSGAELSLEPMDSGGAQPATAATPRTAQAAADLIRAREMASERNRLLALLGALVLVVGGMGGYFYVAVYMPWLLLPKPAAAPPATSPVRAQTPVETIPPMEVAPLRPPASAPRPAIEEKPAFALPEQVKPVPQPKTKTIQASDGVRVAPAATPAVNDGVLAAYDLLQAGQYEQARQAYERLRVAQPANTDILLGLAVVAQNQNRNEDAAQLYLRTLELDPRNAFAQAGLVGLISRADPAAAEAKLTQLIQQRPAAYLHFALGNVYAAQGRWAEAQAAYFDAQRLEPDSADYAFNLAVSLEHIKQPRSAAEYYQRALRLMQGKAVHFDPAQARSRLQKLSQQ